MRLRGASALIILLAFSASPTTGGTAEESRVMNRQVMFVTAYDEMIAKLNAFADAYDETGSVEPLTGEARAVRRAWKSLSSAEPWFREPHVLTSQANEACSETVRGSYTNFLSALNAFATTYFANDAQIFPAEDAAEVRTAWHCLTHVVPDLAPSGSRLGLLPRLPPGRKYRDQQSRRRAANE